jgi:hypothetical protein
MIGLPQVTNWLWDSVGPDGVVDGGRSAGQRSSLRDQCSRMLSRAGIDQRFPRIADWVVQHLSDNRKQSKVVREVKLPPFPIE